uniref:Uncharacterized protein n=1 Tax=Hyaloperonospora arabidopsidis (strain Emoy2) TaxID=559515 RepID=M4B3H8_HYAAE
MRVLKPHNQVLTVNRGCTAPIKAGCLSTFSSLTLQAGYTAEVWSCRNCENSTNHHKHGEK